MKKTKLEKGITLIALIITIVILLILAVVTIGAVKDSSIIDHAQNAATDYKKAQEEEQITLGYSEYKIESISNPNAELKVQGATVTKNGNNGWTVKFESGNTYKLSPDGNVGDYEPVVNPDPTGWDIAFVHNGTSWVDTRVTSQEEVEGAKIVAKFYKETLSTPMKPGDLPLDPSNPITFDESNEVYSLYIEGTGDMGTLVSFNENGVPTGAYGYQSGFNGLLGGTSTEPILMPYVTEIVICEGITNIGEGAFAGATSLQELTIAGTVETIGAYAFVCNYLDKIVVPGNIIRIGSSAFENSQAKSLVIEEGVEQIAESAFCFCENIEEISLPNSINTIGDYAFSNCEKVVNIVIPTNVTKIGEEAFNSCDLLTNVIIASKGVTTITKEAFISCKKLENVYIECEGTNFTAGENAFYLCSDKLTIYVRKDYIATAISRTTNSFYSISIAPNYNWTAPAI